MANQMLQGAGGGVGGEWGELVNEVSRIESSKLVNPVSLSKILANMQGVLLPLVMDGQGERGWEQAVEAKVDKVVASRMDHALGGFYAKVETIRRSLEPVIGFDDVKIALWKDYQELIGQETYLEVNYKNPQVCPLFDDRLCNRADAYVKKKFFMRHLQVKLVSTICRYNF